jgi:hypothetical protein
MTMGPIPHPITGGERPRAAGTTLWEARGLLPDDADTPPWEPGARGNASARRLRLDRGIALDAMRPTLGMRPWAIPVRRAALRADPRPARLARGPGVWTA